MNFRKKILSTQALAKKIAQLRKQGKVVVFTNGCFDLLHVGHASYLERARKLGDILIVAVDDDASVRALKGPTRPINSVRDRMSVLAALESVSFVTWFGGSNPTATIRRLHPDVLVKGGDWKPAQILGSKDVLGWGGKVKSLPFVDGKSTSRMIARAQK